MSGIFSLPSRRALAREYLIWSFGIAAINGAAATVTILGRDPEGIYDPQREIVHALLSRFLTVFLVAAMPLAVMALRRSLGARVCRGYAKLRRFLHADEGGAPAANPPRASGPASGFGLFLEYVLMTTLIAPFFSLIVIAVLGGFEFLVPFGILFTEFLFLFGPPPAIGSIDPEVRQVIGVVAVPLFLWSVPILVAAGPAFCVTVRLILTPLLRVLARTPFRSRARP